jgi:aryl-phospho-beta-D-glucosidase BglC (GH1 family)
VNVNGTVYQENTSCQWYEDSGTVAVPAWTGPVAAPTGVTLPTCTPPTTTATPPPVTGGFGIQVAGSKFVSSKDGSPVQIVGANVSGLETGFNWRWGSFQTAGVGFWKTVLNWNGSGINTVRLPLNEASWLNYICQDPGTGASASHYTAVTGGYQPDPAGAYQATVKQAVADATAAGLYVILDLHWSAPNGTNGVPYCPIGQSGYADATNSVTFWKQLADAFKGNPAVIFELFNEPYGDNNYSDNVTGTNGPGPDATMLQTGGNFSPWLIQDNGNNSVIVTTQLTYPVASMPSMLNAIRGEGATNVVLASPAWWAGEIETWLGTYNGAGNPDPLKQFGAAWHIYGYAKGTSYPAAVQAAGYPIVITETYGFDSALDGQGNTSGYTWAKANGIGYLCWGPINDWGGQALSVTSTSPWGTCSPQ